MKLCRRVTIQIKKVSRHKMVRRAVRSGTLLRKTLVRNAALSVVPSALNDVVIHHAPLNQAELLHVTIDSMTVNTLSSVASILLTAAKL